MKVSDAFGTYHPAIIFIFFASAITFGVLLQHPTFCVFGMALSAMYHMSVRGKSALPIFAVTAVLFFALSLLNPVFNPMGDTVLFSYLGGRSYTWEALAFGMSTAAMFATMLLWFASFNVVMTTDKLVYLFGGIAPSLSLVLTMVMRLVPHYGRKVGQLAAARACLGGTIDEGSARDRARSGASLLSALVTWAFEHGITTSDSMRSRGYGTTRRTSFVLYRFAVRDAVLLVLIIALAFVVIICVILGAADVEYLPTFIISEPGIPFYIGLASYVTLLSLPTLINITEALKWRILLSKI